MHPVRAGRCVDCGGYTYPGTGHYRDCRAELLIIALRALDGEG
ncbi:MAG TPA: hypothetical protein VEA99_10390 [Gemmatimonadaceae bacterium]|nr:hypothetical protein [Gemmatimonadaceae bacterium]